MATTAPMRDGPPAGSGTGGDSRVTNTSTPTAAAAAAAATTTNFEYDDNEWEIGIGNLIIDLDADIEKTNEKSSVGNLTSTSGSSMAAASATNTSSGGTGSSGKSNKTSGSGGSGSSSVGSASSNSGNGSSSGGGSQSGNSSSTTSSSAVEHSSTVENKSLKMKIKRTKSGSKSSEKHEIVKPNEQNGGETTTPFGNTAEGKGSTSGKHSSPNSVGGSGNATSAATGTATSASGTISTSNCSSTSSNVNSGSNKRGSSSSHRRDKTKEKHTGSGDKANNKSNACSQSTTATAAASTNSSSNSTDLNGIVRSPLQRVMYPIQTNGPGPPNAPGPPPSPSKEQSKTATSTFSSNSVPVASAGQPTSLPQVTATSVVSSMPNAISLNQSLTSSIAANSATVSNVNSTAENGSANIAPSATAAVTVAVGNSAYTSMMDDGLLPRPPSPSSPPCKKIKTVNCLVNDNKETKDACVGTSISTMTEPDCLGPCEPGTSVTLEGIVWHETEGVLVVNVTWRGKTYVGTLLDCTRHDWAPPRFCDSPTSDLDARLPKGRAKRGRAVTNDLSNFTETRSSVHSKLRSSSNGSNKGTRKGLSNSPTPFVSPRPESGGGKRKNRPSEEESASPQANGKKSKSSSQMTTISPPSSPVFFECPEANCCKKYKHLNGLKYHQSHAHGGSCAADDEDATKESGSLSENDEIPSPTDPQSIKSERKDENSESEPATPLSSETALTSLNLPSSPHIQNNLVSNLMQSSEPVPVELTPPPVDNKTVVKPGVLRFGVPATVEDVSFSQTNTTTTSTKLSTTSGTTGIRPIITPASSPSLSTNLPPFCSSSTVVTQTHSPMSPPPPSITQQVPLSPTQSSAPSLPHTFSSGQQLQSSPVVQSLPLNATTTSKVPQFNVKPTSVLLQDDKTKDKTKCLVPKKKNRKSPGSSPHSQTVEQSQYKLENTGREDVHSPAYSDISDDGAPVLEAEIADPKNKALQMDKKPTESSGAHSPHAMQHYNMYPFFTQPPYLVPSVTPDKIKEEKGEENKLSDKEKKDGDVSQKLLPSHFYPYDSYVPNYGYNLSQNYPIPMVSSNNDKEIKEESKSPGPTDLVKQPSTNAHSAPNVISYPSNLSNKSKMETSQSKVTGDNYCNMKERSEARSPLNASSTYLHSRQQQSMQQHSHMPQIQQLPVSQMQTHSQSQSSMSQVSSQVQQQLPMHQMNPAHQQPHEDMRRYYGNVYPDQRRKDQHSSHSEATLKATPPPTSINSKNSMTLSGSKHKEKQQIEDKKDDKVKQEGVKPTMETQGPPPPPTSSYAYFHPSGYLQPPYVPFDPTAHSVYRGMNPMIMPTSPYGNSPYLHHPAAQMHAQIPRYGPEDLSRPPSGSSTKALDLLHHQASQYYSPSHKIHELQERALKSPTPKVSTTNASPSATANGQPATLNSSQLPPTSTVDRLSTGGATQNVKSTGDGKDSRSPPPQRHVHTHHHTHVGLGYPLLPAQYTAPYGAAVLASEQAAAVASAGSNPYSPK